MWRGLKHPLPLKDLVASLINSQLCLENLDKLTSIERQSDARHVLFHCIIQQFNHLYIFFLLFTRICTFKGFSISLVKISTRPVTTYARKKKEKEKGKKVTNAKHDHISELFNI